LAFGGLGLKVTPPNKQHFKRLSETSADMSLSVATQGSQSLTIPALLAAALVNENLGKDEITLKFEDAETVKGDKAAAVLVLGGSPPIYGDLQVVKEVVKAYPNALLGTQQKHVSP
jgi:hypothetical protein